MLVALTIFSTNAFAEADDVTTNADIDFSNAISSAKVEGTVNTMTIGGANTYLDSGWLRNVDGTCSVAIAEEERAGTKDIVTVSFDIAWGNKNGMGSGFRMVDAEGEYVATFQMARWDGKGTNANTLGIDMTGAYGSHNGNKPYYERATHFEIQFNYKTKLITSTITCPNPSKTATFSVAMTNTNPIASFEHFAYNVGANTDRADAFDNLKITTTEGDYNVATATYTVKWVCDGVEIKASEERSGDVGDPITLIASDKEKFYNEDKTEKYAYVSDDAAEAKIAADGSTVITITYKKLATYDYTAKAFVGDEDEIELGAGTLFEDETETIFWSKYAKASNGKWFAYSGTEFMGEVNSIDTDLKVDYDTMSDINYFWEIEKMKASKSTPTPVSGNKNYSGGAGAGHANGARFYVEEPIEAGAYTINYYGISRRSGSTSIGVSYIDAEGGLHDTGVVLTWSNAGTESVLMTAEGVKIPACNGIAFIETTNNNSVTYSDYVTMEKTGEVSTYTITVNEVEGGVLKANATESPDGLPVKLTVQPNAGYDLVSVTVTDAEGAAVELAEDYSFVMPASNVTVSAEFAEKVIYVETDMTNAFSALTQASNWTTIKGSSAGYTATNFCPAVTTNAGQTVQVCEYYDGSCNYTGDVLYQTVTGLAPGTYKIELYGAAAYTFGRGFSSEAFSEGTWNAGDKIDPTEENPTGVSLTATTSEGTYGGEIPIWYATNFPEGASVVTLDGVVVGENGEVTLAMSKTSLSTNWHVIQLKGVTAQVLAKDALAAAVAAAEAVDTENIPEVVANELATAVEENNKKYDTAEEYKAAIDAINAATAKANAYAGAAGYFAKMGAVLETTNVYTEDAYNAYYGDWYQAYEAGTLDNAVVASLTSDLAYNTGWHAANNIDDILLSAWTIGGAQCKDYDTSLYINTWSTEGNSDGTEFRVPFFEYWTGDTNSLGANTLQATLIGLEPGTTYEMTAWTRVRVKNGSADAPYGISIFAGADEAEEPAVEPVEGDDVSPAAPRKVKAAIPFEGEAVEGTQFYLAELSAQGTADAEGNLVFGFDVAADNNISWLSFKNVTYAEYVPVPEISNPTFDVPTDYQTEDLATAGSANSKEVSEWTSNGGAAWSASAVYEYGTATLLNSASAPAADINGNTEGGALGITVGWGGAVTYYQTVTLPAGNYILSAEAYNAYTETQAASLLGFVPDEGDAYLSDRKSYPSNEWVVDQVSFTLTEKTTGKIQVGIQAISGGSNSNAKVFFDNVTLQNLTDEEMAAAELAAAKEEALKALEGYKVGEDLFAYSEEGINAAKEAIEAATTPEEVAAALATAADAQILPEEGVPYQFTLATSEGEFQLKIDGTSNTIAEEGTPIYFVAQEDGAYALTADNENYIVYEGSNNWTMTTSAEPYGWTINALADGGYNIVGKNGMYGTNTSDGNAAGSPCYGDKKASNGNVVWNIKKMEDESEPEGYITVNDEQIPVIGTVEVSKKVLEKTAYGADTAKFKVENILAFFEEGTTMADLTAYWLNPDSTTTAPVYGNGTIDGWRNAEGFAAQWGESANGLCVKIQDPATGLIDYIGAHDTNFVNGDSYAAPYAFVKDGKAVVLSININFVDALPAVERNILDVEIAKTVDYTDATDYFQEKTVSLTEEEIKQITDALGIESLDDATIFGYNPSTGEFVESFGGYDGWRGENGDFHNFTGTVEAPICVKINDRINYLCYNILGAGGEVSTYWAYANDEDAVLVKVDAIFPTAYKVTVAETANGTVEAEWNQFAAGADVYLFVEPAEDAELAELKAVYTTEEGEAELEISQDEDGDYYFTMPAADVTVTAVFQKSYEFVAEEWQAGDPGRISPDNVTYNEDGTITVDKTGSNNVNLQYKGTNEYNVSADNKYFTITASGISTDTGASYLWWLNNKNDGSQIAPTEIVENEDGTVTLIWDLSQVSIAGTLGTEDTVFYNAGGWSTCFGLTLADNAVPAVVSNIGFLTEAEKEAVGINGVNIADNAMRSLEDALAGGRVFDLSGRQVRAITNNGIYIVNGRKMAIKK